MQEMQSQAKTMMTVKEALEGHNDTMIGGLVQLSSYCCLKQQTIGSDKEEETLRRYSQTCVVFAILNPSPSRNP